MPIDDDELAIRFQYHPPTGNQPAKYEAIRQRARAMASFLTDVCPESPELALAVTHLEECVMWANAAIARRE